MSPWIIVFFLALVLVLAVWLGSALLLISYCLDILVGGRRA